MTGPLAYVFWHRPASGLDTGQYEAALAGFHEALGAAQPVGFRRSFTLRTDAIPWLGAGGPGYEDWYLVESSCALDEINAAAVGPAALDAHDRAARSAVEGVAGLYRLYAGTEISAARSGTARWLDMPGPDAARLAARIAAGIAAGIAEGHSDADGMWRRQMTLGPSPEFCAVLTGPAPQGDLVSAIGIERSLLGG